MTKHFSVPMAQNILSDKDFQDRATERLKGEVRKNLKMELEDVSKEHEAEAFALLLEFQRGFSDEGNDRLIFRVDRQSLENLTLSLNQVLKKDEKKS